MKKHLKRFLQIGLPILGAVAAGLAGTAYGRKAGRQEQKVDMAHNFISDYQRMLNEGIQASNNRLGPEDPLITKYRQSIK